MIVALVRNLCPIDLLSIPKIYLINVPFKHKIELNIQCKGIINKLLSTYTQWHISAIYLIVGHPLVQLAGAAFVLGRTFA